MFVRTAAHRLLRLARGFPVVVLTGPRQSAEFKSGATFQTEWLRGLHTWRGHAAGAKQVEPLLVCGAPGNAHMQGVGVAHWRDALAALTAPV
jgi:hypothetical protein